MSTDTILKVGIVVVAVVIIGALLYWLKDNPCKLYRWSSVTTQPAYCLKENVGL